MGNIDTQSAQDRAFAGRDPLAAAQTAASAHSGPVTALARAATAPATAPVAVPANGNSLARLSDSDREAVLAAVAASLAPNTRSAYRVAFARWSDWTAGRGFAALPAQPDEVAAHLLDLAKSKSVATVKLAKAAIGAYHRAAGFANPTTAEVVRKTMKAVADNPVVEGRGQAKPLTADDLAAVQATAGLPRAIGNGRRESDSFALVRGLQDSAMAGLLFQGALRRSEVSALEWRDLAEAPSGGLCEGLLVTVRKSKTNRDGSRTDVRFVKGQTAEALRRLRELAEAQADYSDRNRVLALSPKSIGNRFAAACEAAGIGKRTAHAGRVGHASEATLRGASMQAVMESGGWQSADMVAHYSAAAGAATGTVARFF